MSERPLSGIEMGRLAFIVEQSITRRGLFPKYDRHKGYVAFHQLLKEYQRQLAALRGEVKHANSFDETASYFETRSSNRCRHGEDRTWDSLTDEQRQYWIEKALFFHRRTNELDQRT